MFMSFFDRKKTMIEVANNFHAIRHQIMSGRKVPKTDMNITHSQLALIFMISHHENITISEIANNLNISKSAVTQLIDGLVRLDLVKKENDLNDRRVNNLALTEKSELQIKKMHDCFMKKITDVFEILNDNDLAMLNKITSKLLIKREQL